MKHNEIYIEPKNEIDGGVGSCDPEEAEFWGVYAPDINPKHVDPDGYPTVMWVMDKPTLAEALQWAKENYPNHDIIATEGGY